MRDDRAADRDRAQALADQRTLTRCRAAANRDAAAADRDLKASCLDQAGGSVDVLAVAVRQAALDREQAAIDRAQVRGDADQRSADRAEAIADRASAANDRAQAAIGRAGATLDRQTASAELKRAQFDSLTGAVGLKLGLVTLEAEMNRARRGSGRLVLAYLDVDELKAVNDRHGHAAGDALLCDVVDAIQQHLRSYDVIVRVGGDEFVCTLGDSAIDDARRRFVAIRATLEQLHPQGSFTVGFVALGERETLDQLRRRGDAALYEAKRCRHPCDAVITTVAPR